MKKPRKQERKKNSQNKNRKKRKANIPLTQTQTHTNTHTSNKNNNYNHNKRRKTYTHTRSDSLSEDKRFAAGQHDPRFQRMPVRKRTFKVDERFKAMLEPNNPRFAMNCTC